jgi:hypothetical protein
MDIAEKFKKHIDNGRLMFRRDKDLTALIDQAAEAAQNRDDLAAACAEIERLKAIISDTRKEVDEIHDEYCPATQEEKDKEFEAGMYNLCGCRIMGLLNSLTIDMIASHKEAE